jgi:hypothetical protein
MAMKDHWPIDATDEECSLRVFKDALMKYSREALLFPVFRTGEGGRTRSLGDRERLR